jgi:hypothetical protein
MSAQLTSSLEIPTHEHLIGDINASWFFTLLCLWNVGGGYVAVFYRMFIKGMPIRVGISTFHN